MERVRLGFLTTARINDAILDGARRGDAAEVVAVGSRDRARAEAYAREHGIERAHGSYDDVLADPDVDAVYVALPAARHAEWATRALEAGKHVLVEKPFSTRPEEVERPSTLPTAPALSSWRASCTGTSRPAKRLSGSLRGAIGKLRLVRAQFSFTLDRPGDVRCGRRSAAARSSTSALLRERLAARGRRARGRARRAGRRADRRRRPLRRRPPLSRRRARALRLRLRPAPPPRGRGRRLGGDAAPLARVRERRRRARAAPRRRGGGGPIPAGRRYQLEVENFAAAVRGDEPPLLGRADAVGQARALAALLAAVR